MINLGREGGREGGRLIVTCCTVPPHTHTHAVLESSCQLSLNISTLTSPTPTSPQTTPTSATHTCVPYLLLSWRPALTHQTNTSGSYSHVTLCSHLLLSLSARLCSPGEGNRTLSGCVLLDASEVISAPLYRLPYERLRGTGVWGMVSTEGGVADSEGGVVLWVELQGRLGNGSLLRVESGRRLWAGLTAPCPDTNTG